MSRYSNTFASSQSGDEVLAKAQQFFQQDGFRQVSYKGGEVLWKKGVGILTAPQFIKVEVQGNTVRIEGFIRFFGEMGVEGIVGVIPKQMLKTTLTALENQLR